MSSVKQAFIIRNKISLVMLFFTITLFIIPVLIFIGVSFTWLPSKFNLFFGSIFDIVYFSIVGLLIASFYVYRRKFKRSSGGFQHNYATGVSMIGPMMVLIVGFLLMGVAYLRLFPLIYGGPIIFSNSFYELLFLVAVSLSGMITGITLYLYRRKM